MEWKKGNDCESLMFNNCELILYQKVQGEYFAYININYINIISLRTFDEKEAKEDAIKKLEEWIVNDIEKKKNILLELRCYNGN